MSLAEIQTGPKVSMTETKVIGLIAGKGEFPLLLARAASDQGYRVEAFCIKHITDPALDETAAVSHWLDLGQFSRMIEICHERDIERIAMAGNVPHTAIFRYRGFDKRSLTILKRMADRKAESILGAITAELAREHIEVMDSTYFLRSLMPRKGLLTPKRRLTRAERLDMRVGLPLAREIGRLDIGQTVAVKDQAVVAVESIEGTDAMILRAGEVAGPGFLVCKAARPNQDSRYDVPVTGLQTVKSLVKAGAGGMVIEAGHTLFFNQVDAIELATDHGIAIYAENLED